MRAVWHSSLRRRLGLFFCGVLLFALFLWFNGTHVGLKASPATSEGLSAGSETPEKGGHAGNDEREEPDPQSVLQMRSDDSDGPRARDGAQSAAAEMAEKNAVSSRRSNHAVSQASLLDPKKNNFRMDKDTVRATIQLLRALAVLHPESHVLHSAMEQLLSLEQSALDSKAVDQQRLDTALQLIRDMTEATGTGNRPVMSSSSSSTLETTFLTTSQPKVASVSNVHSSSSQGNPDGTRMAGICYGKSRGLLRKTTPNMKKFLADYYDLDLFYALQSEDAETDDDNRKYLQETFGDRLKVLYFGEPPSKDFMNETIRARNDTLLSKYAFEYWWSNAITLRGNTLWQYYWQGKSFNMTLDYEKEHNVEYRWFLNIRVDDMFTWYPPPMEFLNSESKETDGMHIPIGEDYCGVNDRFGIISRNAADVYFGRYKQVLYGSYSRDVGLAESEKMLVEVNAESSTYLMLRTVNVPIYRFQNVRYIACPDMKKECTAANPCWNQGSDCGRTGGKAKYGQEYQSAQMARNSQVRWTRGGVMKFRPKPHQGRCASWPLKEEKQKKQQAMMMQQQQSRAAAPRR